jgi:hypothetical protein
MSKVILTALFSARDARKRVGAAHYSRDVVDVRRVETSWDRAAEGFRKQDPTGAKLAALVRASRGRH